MALSDHQLTSARDAFINAEKAFLADLRQAQDVLDLLAARLHRDQAPHLQINCTQRPMTWGGLLAHARAVGLKSDIAPSDATLATEDRLVGALRCAILSAGAGRRAMPL